MSENKNAAQEQNTAQIPNDTMQQPAAQAPESQQPQTAPKTGRKKKEKVKRTVGQEILSWVLTLLAAVVIALLVRTFIFEPVRVDGHSMDDTLADGEIMFVTKFDYSSTWLCFPWQSAADKEAAARFTIGGDPKRFDVVICRYPDRGDTNFVKRVAGLPGDTIRLSGGYLYIKEKGSDEEVRYEEVYINDEYRAGSSNEQSDFLVPSKGDPLKIDSDGILKVNGEPWPWISSRLSGKAENGDRLLYYYDQKNRKQVLQLNGKNIESAEEMNAVVGVEFKLENDFFFVMGDHRNNSNDSRAQGPIDRTMIVGHVQQVVYPFSKWRAVPNGLDVKAE